MGMNLCRCLWQNGAPYRSLLQNEVLGVCVHDSNRPPSDSILRNRLSQDDQMHRLNEFPWSTWYTFVDTDAEDYVWHYDLDVSATDSSVEEAF